MTCLHLHVEVASDDSKGLKIFLLGFLLSRMLPVIDSVTTMLPSIPNIPHLVRGRLQYSNNGKQPCKGSQTFQSMINQIVKWSSEYKFRFQISKTR